MRLVLLVLLVLPVLPVLLLLLLSAHFHACEMKASPNSYSYVLHTRPQIGFH